jgi:hypothetical protein
VTKRSTKIPSQHAAASRMEEVPFPKKTPKLCAKRDTGDFTNHSVVARTCSTQSGINFMS